MTHNIWGGEHDAKPVTTIKKHHIKKQLKNKTQDKPGNASRDFNSMSSMKKGQCVTTILGLGTVYGLNRVKARNLEKKRDAMNRPWHKRTTNAQGCWHGVFPPS